MGDVQQQRKAFLEGVKDLAWKTYELEEIVKNMGDDTQPLLEERLMQYITGVTELAQTAPAFEGVRFPQDLLSYMDEGGNPHQYTAEVFEAVTRDNQAAKGKVQAVAQMQTALMSAMEKEMPAQVQAYREMVQQRKAGQEHQ